MFRRTSRRDANFSVSDPHPLDVSFVRSASEEIFGDCGLLSFSLLSPPIQTGTRRHTQSRVEGPAPGEGCTNTTYKDKSIVSPEPFVTRLGPLSEGRSVDLMWEYRRIRDVSVREYVEGCTYGR